MLLRTRRALTAVLSTLLALGALSFLAPSAQAAAGDPTPPDHLVIAAVYGGSGGTSTYDWIELYNPTSSDISLGTVSGGTVTPNYYLCYRGYDSSACSSPMELTGTVEAHHYFFVATSGTAGAPTNGVTPDLDFTAKANNPAGETGPNMGGSTTGGQVLLLNASSNGVATMTGDLSSQSAHDAGVVDAVGWTHYASSAYTQPGSAEVDGVATITGVTGGTANTNVIARNFVDGIPVDTDMNRTDFTAVASTSFAQHSQISDQVALAPIDDTTISLGEAMPPIQAQGSKGTGALTYTASGLPGGISIDPATGIISGTPSSTDSLQGYPVTVTVTDSTPTEPETATADFTLTVSNTLRIDPIADASVHKGEALTPIQVTPHGGTSPYTYAATGLPDGVAISNTGEITGTPTDAVGKYSVKVTVTDSAASPQTATADFNLAELPATTGPATDDQLAGLRINEVEATGTPANDWVELTNTGKTDITDASVDLSDASGAIDAVTSLSVPAGGYTVIQGSDMDAAGLDFAASDTLYLSEPDGDTALDQTSWTSYTTTSWARYPDGTGDFAVSKSATEGAANTLPKSADTDHLVVAAVYGADGTTFNSDWVELYNPTDAPISLGTLNSDGTVTPNYYQCYRSNASTSCSSMKLYGTVQPHHYFLVWNGHNADTTVDDHSKGVPPAGITPDLDFRYGSDDTNTADTKAANDPSGQTNNGFGGCNTGGQLWLLDANSGGTAPGGDLSGDADVVSGVGWTASGVTEPAGYEGTGLSSGTNNACVIARNFVDGYPVDTQSNNSDFTTIQNPADYTLESQASERVAITPVQDAEISINEAMEPISVQAQAVYGALTFSATGLPDGVSIDPTTGVISGTPAATDALQDYPVTVTVGDAVASDTTTTSFTLTLSKELRLDPIANTSVHEGSPISEIDVTGHGGTPGYTYAATGLPAGLDINASTGAITGTPTDALGRYSVHVTATDSGSGSAQASVSEDFTLVELPTSTSAASSDPLAAVTLNEVEATGTPSKDWIELYNTGAALSGVSVELEDSEGDIYQVPAQDIAAHGYPVVDGPALAAAGFDMSSTDSLYLAEPNGTLLDQTSWTSYAPTSWARTTDGTGDFAVSAYPTKGATNSGAPVIHPNDLLVSEVNYDNNSTDYYEYSEVTNTTDHPIDFDAYGLSITKSGAVMTLHDPSDTSGSSPLVDPVIPAHGTQLFWWDENQYLGVKTTAQFLANYGLPASTPVVLVQGFSSMANSGGDHSYYISVNQGSTPISQAWVDTPCAANTYNGASVCTATNGNYAEHYAVPADRTNPVADVWYNSLHSGGDDIDYTLGKALSTPGTVDPEQVGFSRAVKLSSVTADAITLHNTSSSDVDLSGYVLEKDNTAGDAYTLPAGTTIPAGGDLVVHAADSALTFADRDFATLLAPQGYAYTDGLGVLDTTGPFLTTLPYDAGPVQIDPTTGLALPPAGGLYRPAGVSAQNGTVYASNTGDNVLATMVDGTNTAIAGSLSGYGDVGDGGPASQAQLYQPSGTAEDAAGDIFIADSGDNVIREITPDGTIHLFAGTGDSGGAGEAVTPTSTALTVNLWHPEGVAVDSSGDVLIADTFDNRVLKVTPGGTVTVVAGTGTAGYTGDGASATDATLSQPAGVAVDAQDDVYIADSSNNVIRRVDATTGAITTVAGDYAADQTSNGCLGGYAGDGGPATSAELNDPQGIAVDGSGDLFIADTFNNAVREVTPDGTISTLVNVGGVAGAESTSAVSAGSLPASAKLNTPYAVAVDPSTNALYIADTKNSDIAEVVNAAYSGNASGPTEPADQVAVTGDGAAATACAVLRNGAVASVSAPAITGDPAVGSTLTASTGTWTPIPDSYTYQWLRDGVAIASATDPTYTVTSADAGHLLSVSVTANKADFAPASATSDTVRIPGGTGTGPGTGPGTGTGTLTTAKPTIAGTFKVGRKLTGRAGAWKADGTPLPAADLGYQWLRDGKAIKGATRSTYTLVAADRGTRISLTVTGKETGYSTASMTSAAHPVAAGTLTMASPSIKGTARVGRTLQAKAGRWKAGTVPLKGSHLTYQWYANGKRIAGAKRASYKIASSLRGKRITVTVTGRYAGYATASRTSKRTAAVKAK